ncbi:MAG: hypothetical protein LBU83_09950 [Bacteroidales bacterium]|jgi:hypothetical protein|nr:hypothetical protein [Bacteroidales bacterium]
MNLKIFIVSRTPNEHIGSMAALPPLDRADKKQVCRPLGSAWKPPLRKAAGTLWASFLENLPHR